MECGTDLIIMISPEATALAITLGDALNQVYCGWNTFSHSCSKVYLGLDFVVILRFERM